MFSHRKIQIICGLSALIIVLTLVVVQVFNPLTTHAATNAFRGVNWADTRDNFVNGPIIPSGLSALDNYATTYVKATAILKGFQANLSANTVRFGINEQTVSSSWWNSYAATFDAATALGMNVMVAPWAPPGGPSRVTDTKAFYNMWDTVINKYNSNSRFYFEIYNEPNGYSGTDWINFAADFVAHYPNVARERIVVAGIGYDDNIIPVGSDSRLNGTLLSLHLYSFNLKHTTEQAWINEFNSRIGNYASRTIVTEFGVPMTTGVNYDGLRDGDNNISYLYAITDSAHNLGMGIIYWPGLRNGDTFSMETLNGSGTDLSLSNNNNSGVDRLKYGYGLTSGNRSDFSPNPSSHYKIVNHNSGLVLEVNGFSSSNGGLIDQYTDNGGTNQQWSFIATSDGYELVNVHSGLVLDEPNWSKSTGIQLEQWSSGNSANQWWNVVSTGSYYSLVNQNSGLYVDVAGYSTTPGAAVIQWTSNGGTNQQWSFVQVS